MFNISNNNHITITRGDAANLVIYINVGTELNPIYRGLNENDRLYFAVMEPNQSFEHALIKKVFTKDDVIDARIPGEIPADNPHVIVKLAPEDTEHLIPGKYYYEVKLVSYPQAFGAELLVDTIISKHKFVIID